MLLHTGKRCLFTRVWDLSCFRFAGFRDSASVFAVLSGFRVKAVKFALRGAACSTFPCHSIYGLLDLGPSVVLTKPQESMYPNSTYIGLKLVPA